MTSWWIASEIGRALERERWLAKVRRRQEPALLGVNLDGHLFDDKLAGSGSADTPAQVVKARLVADFSGWEKKRANLDRPLERLLEALTLRQPETAWTA